jgi:hypothetical protein
MDGTVADSLKRAYREHPEAVFTLFTLAGHVISGRIGAIGRTITLEAGKETAEVPEDRVEAFSVRLT